MVLIGFLLCNHENQGHSPRARTGTPGGQDNQPHAISKALSQDWVASRCSELECAVACRRRVRRAHQKFATCAGARSAPYPTRQNSEPSPNEQNPHRPAPNGGSPLRLPGLVALGADAALTVVLAWIHGGCRGAQLTAPEFQRRLGRLWRAEPVAHRATTLVETQLVIPRLGGSPQAQRLQGR